MGQTMDQMKLLNQLRKAQKELMVIAQNESSCIVYGMPKSVVKAELADEIVPLDGIAKEIITNVGVR